MAKQKPIVRPEFETFKTGVDMNQADRFSRRILESQNMFSRFAIPDSEAAMLGGLRFEEFREEAARQMVMQLKAKIATKKFESQTVIFPADWWQSFKKRWFPAWALKKWPAKHTEVTFEANAYYPDIEIPGHNAFVEIMVAHRQRNG